MGIAEILEELAGAVEKLGFSLVWQVGFSPDVDQLSANLAPAVVVWLGMLTMPRPLPGSRVTRLHLSR